MEIRLKKINWKPLDQHSLSKDCFWKQQQGIDVYCLSEKKDIIGGLAQHFSLPSPTPNVADKIAANSKIKLRVLNGMVAQNLLIALRVFLKDTSYEQIKQHILRCETTKLNSVVIEQLIKSLPKPDKMKELCALNNSGITLLPIEKFIASLSDIEQLVPRLDCMNFMICFDDMVKDLEPYIMTVTAACDEIISSKKFGKILTVVLSICNLMNPGSQTIGFNLDILTKLHDMKSPNGKYTLLHLIVEEIQRKHPECLEIDDELAHVGNAARVSSYDFKGAIEKVTQSSENLQRVLMDIGLCKSSEDMFEKQMSPLATKSHHQVEVLKIMMNEMHNTYLKASKYFAFDINMCSMDDFITNINSFKTQFAKAYTEILIFQEKGMARRPAERPLQGPVFANSKQNQVRNVPIVDTKNKMKILTKECTVKLKRLTKQGMRSSESFKFHWIYKVIVSNYFFRHCKCN